MSAPDTTKINKLKNVIVIDDSADNIGGTAQVAYITAKVLTNRGYNVVYFAGCGPVHKRLDGIRVVVAHDKPFLDQDCKVRGALGGLHSKETYAKLRALLSEYSPGDTVLHVHSWTHALSSSIFDAIADAGFKVLVTLHEYFLVCPNGGFYDYQRNEICHLKPCSATCVLRNCDKRSYAQKLYRVVRIKRQDRSIARAKPKFCYLSDFTYDIMRGNQFDNGSPSFLPNPISTEGHFVTGDPANKSGYLFVGRLDAEKNPRLFCEAMTHLGLEGTMCGSGPLLESLEKEFPNIEFLGWCEKEQLSEQFKTKRALVLTSSCYEASPLVCLEAMFASGIPSIVPETCGATAYIEDGSNGMWFANNDLKSLCRAIERLEDEEYYAKICQTIAKTFPAMREERSYKTYATRVVTLYEGLLNE